MTLLRTTYGNPHYVNDVAENYFRFVGEGNRERIQNRGGISVLPNRIVAPTGANEPFPYSIESHYGASDHEVFNDWTVRVPGVMMIAWPDQWYHTSGDHADKSDPTQLRRTVIIAAATAYTIAVADVDMAQRIAAETFSNATRRLGHQLARAQEELNRATAASLPERYKLAASFIETAVITETKTLKSIAELAPSVKPLGKSLNTSQDRIAEIGSIMRESLESHMQIVAKRLSTTEASLGLTALEREAARLVPRAMPKIRQLEFWGVNAILESLPPDVKARYPLSKESAFNRSELQLLVDGENSVLMIKRMLDAQSPRQSMLEEVLNYLRQLEAAGLVGF
jgi:aminopeptidase YwaD